MFKWPPSLKPGNPESAQQPQQHRQAEGRKSNSVLCDLWTGEPISHVIVRAGRNGNRGKLNDAINMRGKVISGEMSTLVFTALLSLRCPSPVS